MTEASRKVIALGSPTGEHRAAVEAAVHKAGAELSITRESAKALADIEQQPALAVLVDMSALGAEHFCRKARANERLRRVPIIALSRNPGELSFNRIFAWGADDLVPLGAEAPLAARLLTLGEGALTSEAGFGQAVVAEPHVERCTLLGRVLTQAGYDVKYAIDATSAEYYASQSETRVVVLNANLTPPRKLIEAVEQAGALPVWVVVGDQRNVAKLAQALTGIDRVVITSSSGSPEDILFVANELVFSRASKRREWRALYGAPVQFREAGSDANEFGFTYDVSPSGLYVRSLSPCDFSDVWVELRPPRRDKLVRLRGRIVRRFRFGSGSIASAPPGFALSLEGPPDDANLVTWATACRDFLGVQSPFAEPSGGAPVIGARDGTFKKPTPLGTARPSALPADLRPKTVAPPEPEPAPAPTPAAPDEIDEVLGMLEARPPSVGRDSMHSDVGQMLADTLETERERVSSSGALPVTMSFDTKAVLQKPHSELPPAEDTTEKVPARPVVAAVPVKAPAPSPAAPPVAAPSPAAPAAPIRIASNKATLVMGAVAPPPQTMKTAVAPPAQTARMPAVPPPETEKIPGPAAADPRRTAPATPLARTQLLEPDPKSSREPARVVVNDRTSDPHARTLNSAPDLVPPPVHVPQAVAPAMPAPAPLPAAAWASIAASPVQAPAPRPRQGSRGPIILAAVLGFAGVVGAVIGGFLLGLIPTGGASAQRVSQPERVSTPAVVKSAPAAVTPPAPSAASMTKATPSATTAPSPPAASAALPASAPPQAAAPSVAPNVDLSALLATQGYLHVHSSASTKVFVMGREVGETNKPMVTSCGTRFVRLGSKLGHFIEPGGPVIIKCGALTEVKREPK